MLVLHALASPDQHQGNYRMWRPAQAGAFLRRAVCYLQSGYYCQFWRWGHAGADDRIPPITRRMIRRVPLGACSARRGQCSLRGPPSRTWNGGLFALARPNWNFTSTAWPVPTAARTSKLFRWLSGYWRHGELCPACKRKFYRKV